MLERLSRHFWLVALVSTMLGACVVSFRDYDASSSEGGGSTSSGDLTSTSSDANGAGAGGSGGKGGASSSSSAGGSASGGGRPLPQVSCGPDQTLCKPSQVCCVSSDGGGSCDECSDDTVCEPKMGSCTATDYSVFECDSDDDCAIGKHCCAELMDSIVVQVRCFVEACSDGNSTRQMCHDPSECSTNYPNCEDFGYPPYLVCQQ